jgi:hypothetical protein
MKNLLLLLVMLTFGCATSHQFSGDLTPQLVIQLKTCGATVPVVTDLTAIVTQWQVETDARGFVIRLPADRFAEVDAVLRRLFGTPAIWDEKDLAGHPNGVFKPQQAGIAIQYSRTNDRMEIVGLKPPPSR